MNALATALRDKMAADTGAGGVNTLATGGIHRRKANQNAGFPRVEFRELIDESIKSFSGIQADHLLCQVKAMAVDGNVEGAFAASQIHERVRTLLSDPSLTVTGKTMLYCRHDRDIPEFEEWDDAGSRMIYHNGAIYELWLA